MAQGYERQIRTMIPSECQPDDDCLCLGRAATEVVNTEMIKLELCIDREKAREPLLEMVKRASQPEPWWANPTVVIGGVVVSVSVGLAIGAVLAGR